MKRTVLAMLIMAWVAPAALANAEVPANEVLAPSTARTPFISSPARVGEILAILFADARSMFAKHDTIAPIKATRSSRRVGVGAIPPQSKKVKLGLVPPVELEAKRHASELVIGSSRETPWDDWESREATYEDLDYRDLDR
jgi:hypothetical protein